MSVTLSGLVCLLLLVESVTLVGRLCLLLLDGSVTLVERLVDMHRVLGLLDRSLSLLGLLHDHGLEFLFEFGLLVVRVAGFLLTLVFKDRSLCLWNGGEGGALAVGLGSVSFFRLCDEHVVEGSGIASVLSDFLLAEDLGSRVHC